MAVTSSLYGGFFESVCAGKINLGSDTINVMLLTASYTPSLAHQYKSDVVADEVSGTGYTAGGNAVAITTALSSGTYKITPTSPTATWTNSTISANYAVLYDATPSTDATRPLIGYINFGETVADTNGTFTITWDATNGLFYLTV